MSRAVTAEQVYEWLDLSYGQETTGEMYGLEQVCTAVSAYVDGLPHIERTAGGEWAPMTSLGAVMLAARLFRRRNSASGTEAIGEMFTYISRNDSDIARMLKIDTFKKPVIG